MEKYRKSILRDSDVYSAVECAREEGREEGIERGIERGRREGVEKERNDIIQKSLQMNMPIEVIVELTGYSKEQIINYKTRN